MVPKKRTGLGRLIERGLKEAIAFERGELPVARRTRHPITARDAHVERRVDALHKRSRPSRKGP